MLYANLECMETIDMSSYGRRDEHLPDFFFKLPSPKCIPFWSSLSQIFSLYNGSKHWNNYLCQFHKYIYPAIFEKKKKQLMKIQILKNVNHVDTLKLKLWVPKESYSGAGQYLSSLSIFIFVLELLNTMAHILNKYLVVWCFSIITGMGFYGSQQH